MSSILYSLVYSILFINEVPAVKSYLQFQQHISYQMLFLSQRAVLGKGGLGNFSFIVLTVWHVFNQSVLHGQRHRISSFLIPFQMGYNMCSIVSCALNAEREKGRCGQWEETAKKPMQPIREPYQSQTGKGML